MTGRRRTLLIAAAIVALLLLASVVGVRVWLPSWLRQKVERVGSETLARKVTVAGPLSIRLLPAPRLSVEGVTLANAAWGSEPEMARIGRLSFTLAPGELVSGRIHVSDVELEGVRVLLERDSGGVGNWVFALPARSGPPKPRREPPLIDRASVHDVALVIRNQPQLPPLRVSIGSLAARLEPGSEMVDLAVDGRLNDAAWQLEGKLGTLRNIYAARDVEHALTGRIGGASRALRGRIRDPLSLGGPDLTAEVRGPDAAAAMAVLGIEGPLTGPYRLDATLRPSAAEGVDVQIRAEASGIEAEGRGQVSALLDPARAGAEVTVRGPDASVIGAWTGVQGLPAKPYEVRGRARRDGQAIVLEGVALRVGRTDVTVDGTIGPPPRCVGTALAITGSGPDLSELSALAHVRLPPGTFRLEGRFLRRADALAIERTELRAAGMTVRAEGTVAALDLSVEASGPDPSPLDGIVGTTLPRAPFHLRGRVARQGAAYALHDVDLDLDGNRARINGLLLPAPRAAGSSLAVHVAGPSVARAAALWTKEQKLPDIPYDVAGLLVFETHGLSLDEVAIRAGGISADVSGHLATDPFPAGTAFTAAVRGDDLAEIAVWGVHGTTLPQEPFTAAGKVRVDEGGWHVDGGRGDVGDDHVELSGIFEPLDVEVKASGSSLSTLARFFPKAEIGKRLPNVAYTAAGKLRHTPAGLELSSGTAKIGETTIRLDGTASAFRFDVEGPDASLPEALLGKPLPDGALRASGTIERGTDAVRMDDVAVSIGEAEAKLKGVIGASPSFVGTDVEIAASGADFSAMLTSLPAKPFELSARIRGDAAQITASPFSARLGDSDVSGSITLLREGSRRAYEADLTSRRLSLKRQAEPEPEPSAVKPAKKEKKEKKGPVIPDDPLPLDRLRDIDAHVRLAVGELNLPTFGLRDVSIDATVRDGAVRVDPIEGTGGNGGRAQGKVLIEPAPEGFTARAEGRLDGGRLDLPKSDVAPAEAPTLDVEWEIEGAGRSLKEIAAKAQGRALVVLGEGKIPNTLGDLATSAPIAGLLDALNPFRKSSPYTPFECGIAAAQIAGGKAAIEPIAARTDKMTILGKGKVDLDTEAIDLVWTIKPRRGVGITPGSITNPYIKLGGTLASPSLEAKPLEAAASTGAAVATGGLTLLFRGLYDRITAERKVCVNALERARKDEAEKKASP